MVESLMEEAKKQWQGEKAGIAVQLLFGQKTRKQKNSKGNDMFIEHDKDLNMPEFTHLMTSGLVDEYFPNGWAEGAYHMRLLKNVYASADLDGDNELEQEEFAVAINSLHTGTLSPKDIELMWSVLNPQKAKFITFAEFLHGMVRVQAHAVLSKKFHLFTPDTLMSLVLDTPCSSKEEQMLLEHFTMMEKLGMAVLDGEMKEMTPVEKKALLQKATEGKIHVITDEQRVNLNRLHHLNVTQCFVAGLISAALTAIVENIMTYKLHTNGVENPDRCNDDGMTSYMYTDPWTEKVVELPEGSCEKSPYATVVMFWSGVGIALGICCLAEIVAMYWYSIQNAVRVANVMDLRLVPLNKDRAFVGGSLVRAALELGNTEGVLFGVDPLREVSTKTELLQLLFAILYIAKIFLSGFFIKILIKRLMTRGSAKFALPWAAVPCTAAWNGFVGHIIMRQAKLRGVGVASAIEIFNAIVEQKDADEEISDLCAIQLCRAVGCNIVKQRDMYPTKEILLKHAVGNLGLVKNGIVAKDQSGVIDDIPDFIDSMKDLSEMETKMVIEVLILCSVLDGRVRQREFDLVDSVFEAAIACGKASDIHADHKMLKYVAQRTRNMYPLRLDDIMDVIKPEPDMQIPGSYYVNECMATISAILAC
jgi:hypothetical protein